MTDTLALILIICCFFVGLTLGLQVVFIMGGFAVIFTYFLWGPTALGTIASTAFASSSNIILMAIPLFIFMGNVLRFSGIGEELFTAVYEWLGNVSGGLAMGTIVISAIIAAMSGVSGAGTIMIGLIALPAMTRFKYDRKLSIGCVASGGVLGILIPPSTIIILYAAAARLSVGQMFFAAFFPGFLLAALYIIYIGIRSHFQPQLAPKAAIRATWRSRIKVLRGIVLPAILVAAVLGGIYLGVYTPTEAAGIGALGAIICAAIHRRLNWAIVKDTVYSTFALSAMVFWLIISAGVFSHIIAVAGAQHLMVQILTSLPFGSWGVIIAIQLLIFILGMLVDDIVIVLLFTPIFVPAVAAFNINQIWFGTLIMININIAWLTPPYGFNLFYMRAIVSQIRGMEDTTMIDIYKSVIPFIGCQLLCLIIVMMFPQIALFLPSMMVTK